MALANTELFTGPTTVNARERLNATALKVVQFATNASASLLPVGTPVVFDSSALKWKVYTQGGMNDTDQIRAFVYESTIQLSASAEVLGLVMIRGEAYAPDVNTAAIRAVLAGSPSEANVQTALRDEDVRKLGLDIRGLTLIR